jgi:hypothetical protein
MKKLIASVAAAGVLVAGAFVASSAVTSPAVAQTTDTTTEETQRPQKGQVFEDVLDGLVTDGTIDSAQADAIKEAFRAKRDELGEEFGDRRGGHHPFKRGVLRSLFSDDVITSDEIASLPDDHPLRTGESSLAELLEDDGQITREEFDAFAEENRPERGERPQQEQQEEGEQDEQDGVAG